MVRLVNQLIVVIAFALGIAWSFLCSFVAIPTFLVSFKAGSAIHRLFARGWFFLLGIHLHVEGEENLPDRGILAPNHESMFDIVVLAALPANFRWISKEQVGKIPIIGWAMWAMGCYFLKRDRSGHDLNVLKVVEDGLKEGAMVVIFPEGTRSRSGELLPLKKGAFRTAINAGVPVIPIAIRGTRDIAPPGHIPERRGHHVRVSIGAPLFPGDYSSLEDYMDSYRRKLEGLLHSMV